MKKERKRIICFLFAICMIVTSLIIPDTQASAATVTTQKVHIGVKQTWSDSIRVSFAKGEYKIANLKSSSKNLYVRTTGTYSYSGSTGSATIQMYAKKKGTYTVSFDVVDHENKKTTSHKATVYANNDIPIKSVTFGGEPISYGLSAKAKGKFKVTMTKGYQLQSIKVTTYNKSGKAVTKNFKNGSSITLGSYRYKTIYSTANDNWRASLLATTSFEITYKDKYTKEARTSGYTLYRVPKN